MVILYLIVAPTVRFNDGYQWLGSRDFFDGAPTGNHR